MEYGPVFYDNSSEEPIWEWVEWVGEVEEEQVDLIGELELLREAWVRELAARMMIIKKY